MAATGRQQQIMAAGRRPNVRRGPVGLATPPPPGAGGRRPARGDTAAGARGQTGRPGRGRGGLNAPPPAPWDARAEREATETGLEHEEAGTDLAAKRRSEQEQSGLGPAGADNPYSDAAMLKRQREAGSRGQLNTAGNQLYAGSTLNAQDQIASTYDQGFNALTAADAAGQAAYERGKNTANKGYELGLAKIREGALDRVLQSEPAPLAVGPGGGRGGRRVVRRSAPSRSPNGAAGALFGRRR
jgi:hypothetical protein